MSKILQIVKAKPNPIGKDKTYGIPRAEQLLGEWVDIKNIGNEFIFLSDISLSHTQYNNYCRKTGVETYWSKDRAEILRPNQTVRVHTGSHSDTHLMKINDWEGCNLHGFAGRKSFVLNNYCGDILTVYKKLLIGTADIDTVSFDGNQPEGAVLIRKGDKLVVPSYV